MANSRRYDGGGDHDSSIAEPASHKVMMGGEKFSNETEKLPSQKSRIARKKGGFVLYVVFTTNTEDRQHFLREAVNCQL